MYYLDKNQILTIELLSKYLNDFNTLKLPRLKKLKNYYDGKQDILQKYYVDESKPCNKIVVNFCSGIVDNFNGYLTGIPITYKSDVDFTDISNVLRYNDYQSEDSEFLKNALIYGKAYEIIYVDEQSNICFNSIDTTEGFVIYSNDLKKEMRYFIRQYLIDPCEPSKGLYVEVYTDKLVEVYKCSSIYDNYTLVSKKEHYFNQVPVVAFGLNNEECSSFEKIMTMQDAYNKLLSSAEDDFESFCDAYMLIKGMSVDEEELVKMKTNRVLLLDEEGSVEYLTKDIKDTALNNMLDELNGKIHRVSNSPDFGDENFANASGVSLKYKLIGFENTASNIATRMVKALQKRIELIVEILHIKNNAVWRDVDIIISRNLPVDLSEIVDTVVNLKGIVSNTTLLSQIPFIKDIEKEKELLADDVSVTNVDGGDDNG